MVRRSFLAMAAIAIIWTVALGAQVKEVRPINTSRVVDINSASDSDIAAIGIDKAVAAKIVAGRPYRNKHDLVTRKLLSAAEYDKVKSQIVARQPLKK